MKQQKAGSTIRQRAINMIQACNTFRGGSKQLVVARDGFGIRVLPVRKKREMQKAIRICEIVNFERANQLFNLALARKQRRYGHDRSQVFRYAVEQLETWQCSRLKQVGNSAVDQRNGQFRRGNHSEQT